MDKILEKHLANALVLVKTDLNISITDENIISYETCFLENNKYEIKTEHDTIVSGIIGYWKDKPIITHNRTKYAILENSNTIVKLKSLNVTDDKIQKTPEEPKNIAPLFPKRNLIVKQIKKLHPIPPKPEPDPDTVANQLTELLPDKNTDKNSVISAYVDTLKKSDQQTKEPELSDKQTSTAEYIKTDKPKSIEEELFSLFDTKKDDPRIKRLFSHYNEQTKKEVHEINEKYSKQYLAKMLENSGGGGTSNSAVDYSKGGTIDGDLTINANLSVVGGTIYGNLDNKRVFYIGNETDTDYIVDHNLNTKDLVISLYDSQDEIVLASVKNINLNQTLVSFSMPIQNIKVVIMR